MDARIFHFGQETIDGTDDGDSRDNETKSSAERIPQSESLVQTAKHVRNQAAQRASELAVQ